MKGAVPWQTHTSAFTVVVRFHRDGSSSLSELSNRIPAVAAFVVLLMEDVLSLQKTLKSPSFTGQKKRDKKDE